MRIPGGPKLNVRISLRRIGGTRRLCLSGYLKKESSTMKVRCLVPK